MTELGIAGSILGGLATAFGLVLAAADRWLRVDEDPRVERVESLLPGTNCGGCGQPGCHAFAEAVVTGSQTPAECTVSPAAAIARIAEFLGVDAGSQERRVARLHCAGGRSAVRRLATYQGLPSCRAAFVVNGGGRACPWGCLGLGDCESACDFDAIHMSVEDLPVVAEDLCTACGDCLEACPVDLFTLEPVSNPLLVQCRNPLAGDAARALCRVACDGCRRCSADAEEGVIEMQGGLPVIREPERATADAVRRCPTGAIRWLLDSDSGDAHPEAS